MKRLLVTLVAVSVLILSVALPAYAAEERTITGTVTVAEIIAVTIHDYGDPGINFNTVAPGTEDNPDEAQDNSTPAIGIVVGPETNVDDLHLHIMGETTGALDLSNWKCDITKNPAYSGSLPASYTYYTIVDVIPTEVPIWCWVDVPLETPADTYTCTYYFKFIPPSEQ
jgi:hypothetical protein